MQDATQLGYDPTPRPSNEYRVTELLSTQGDIAQLLNVSIFKRSEPSEPVTSDVIIAGLKASESINKYIIEGLRVSESY
jgi:hypothetical protein